MVTAYIALGSNLDDPAKRVHLARLAVGDIRQTTVLAASSLYLTQPVDASGDDYVNAVVKVETELNAYDLLAALQQLEHLAGRPLPQDRAHLYHAPRTLDLDILLYGNARIESRPLTVPHPRMRSRAFVLVPLAQIAPELVSSSDLYEVQNQKVLKITS